MRYKKVFLHAFTVKVSFCGFYFVFFLFLFVRACGEQIWKDEGKHAGMGIN